MKSERGGGVGPIRGLTSNCLQATAVDALLHKRLSIDDPILGSDFGKYFFHILLKTLE